MTRVSKQILDKDTEKKLFLQFSKIFVNTSASKISTLFDNILTSSERIMLMKRVAIILMLTEDFSNYKISKTLKVSDSTVRSIKKQYKNREFAVLIKQTKQSSFDREKFWIAIDVLLRLGMPPMGRGRWSSLYK